ncbi:Gfo/Idh/MocA family oxidoreductase, partial [Nocardioides sp. NPDC000441]|uniref:Gfo/Idh/MocA family protein n=1 Tax=Nocardioides sp. NPDC000441 TaxID=3154256 RepID=UPI00333053A9
MTDVDPLGVAVVGAGYWGPNLVRNFRNARDWTLVAVVDLELARAQEVIGGGTDVLATTDLDEVLAREDVDAIAIATPAGTHRQLVERALRAGKHLLLEKQQADDV